MKKFTALFAGFALCTAALADSPPPAIAQKPALPVPGVLALREVRYDGKLSEDEARFTIAIEAEAMGKGESSAALFEGDVALQPAKLPDQLRITRDGNHYTLIAAHSGRFSFKLELVAKIQRAEPWNRISFTGPAAAIASVIAQAGGAGMEVQLLSGTLLDSTQTNGISRVRGFLGADQTVALRWQGKVAEVARKVLITADTTATAHVGPTVIKYTTQIRYDILQGNAARLTLALPAGQALTRLVGGQIRDWLIKSDGDRQLLTVEFIKPMEKQCNLTLYSEQPVETTPATARLDPPQPLEVERESGALTVSAEDTLVELESATGLRQVNATDGALAAYRFNARPFTLALSLRRIEPVISVADRVSARLEETRLLVSHRLALNIEKAGIYALDLTPQPGLTVADVRGEGVEDWKVRDGRLHVNFSARILGKRELGVQLEQALKQFPPQITVRPLRVAGAAKETAQIGAASAPGIRLKTGGLSGLREIPVRALQSRAGGAPVLQTDELLAFTAEQPDWQASLTSERLPARIVADVFNLVTIGDGIVGGSATIRYGLINQGVQEFKVKLPPHCKNVEFTGPNIRRKELAGDLWTIGLQDKVWGGYTLVVTYDYQFDPNSAEARSRGATLPIGGIHPLEVERETGSVAITTAASLKLNAKAATAPLRRVDEFELAAADRALVARAVLLAYQYTGDQYDLAVEVQRHPEERVLEAVADRTQITSVLTDAGEMLTQASFMVKNNEKQFQRFLLPKGANLWGCYVNNQAAKPERDGDWVLVSLPRDVNRDQAFAVDIVYAEKKGAVNSSWPRPLQLTAPRSDVPNTYAEWQLFVPASRRLSSFGGSMSVARGTTYGALDAWQKFLAFYGQVLREAGSGLLVIGALALMVVVLVVSAARRGWNGALTVLVVFAILAVLAGMMLPALSKAKLRAQRISSVNNLKQIGLAARQWALDNGDRFPATFEEMINELGTDKVTYDPATGERYTYLGAFVSDTEPEAVLAYSPIVNGQCNVLLSDGSVQSLSAVKFAELAQRGLVRSSEAMARRAPASTMAGRQMVSGQPATPMVTAPMAIDATTGLPVAGAPTTPSPLAVTAGGLGTGSGGAGGGGVVAAAPQPAPRAAGIRSIRIEIPREGNSILFTKVLNVRDEPLSVRAKMMSLHTYQTVMMLGQVAAFLAGVAVWWWQWRRVRRNSFVLTLALALIIVSVCSLLIAWHALHDLLIISFPCALLGVVAWLVWKYWPRTRPDALTDAHPSLESGLPPVTALFVLTACLAVAGAAQAADATNAVQPTFTAPAAAPASVSVLSARYTGDVNNRVAQIEALLHLSAAKPNQTLALFGDDVAVQQFTVKSGDAHLVRDGRNVAVSLKKRGNTTLQLRLLVKLAGDVTKQHLAFAIPPALSSQVALLLDQPEADVDFPTAISFKRRPEQDKTRVEAVIGSGGRVELRWTPRVKRADEVAATVFCQSTALVTFGGGVMNVRDTLDYQVTQGELRQVRVRLPAGQRLLRVEGEAIRTWEIKSDNPLIPSLSPSDAEKVAKLGEGNAARDGEQILVVELLKGMSPAYRLTVETEKVLDALPITAKVETPHALDVKRETGLVALRGAEELGLTVESAAGLQRVDAEEFARAGAAKCDGLVSVFRFLKPDFDLRARAETVQPQIEVVVRNHARVAADQLSLLATLDYTIKRAGVFALKVALPGGWRIEQVTGAKVLQWTERADGETRLLEVALQERTSGAYALRIELVRHLKELPQSLAIAGVHPVGAAKLTGFVSVAAEPGVAVKSESFDGLTEIPAVSLPDANALGGATGVLAYKFIAADPKPAPDWKLSITTETVEPWVRAEIVNTITLTETLLSGRAQVRYDIANAPVKELRLKIPARFKNVEITGVNIRRRDQAGEEWRVELQGRTRGAHTLIVTWEQPRVAKTNRIELAGVSAAGVERETGLLAIVARAPLQVAEAVAADLIRVDTRELPEWAGRADDATVLTYRYVRPGYALALEAKRFDEAEVLQALVDSARLTTVVADDGQVMTEMALAVRNNGRQFLEVELPGGMAVWSAFVAGQPVRLGRRDGKLLLPLEQSGSDDAPVAVELTYVGTNTFPKTRGLLDFVSPKLDVPLKNARWELYLPADYDYANFTGTMSREAAAGQTSAFSFTRTDYARMEKAGKDAAQAGAKRDLTKAQRKLAEGNVREAAADYNRAFTKRYGVQNGKGVDADVKKFEQELREAQASNLVNAQSDFFFRNYARLGDQAQAVAGAQVAANYDNNAAGEQWAKLQQAQEVVAARVQPLRVNLPIRGLRYGFTQVLQTGVNKPMTIQFQATSGKTTNWLGRIGLGLMGFVMLWALVATVAVRKHA